MPASAPIRRWRCSRSMRSPGSPALQAISRPRWTCAAQLIGGWRTPRTSSVSGTASMRGRSEGLGDAFARVYCSLIQDQKGEQPTDDGGDPGDLPTVQFLAQQQEGPDNGQCRLDHLRNPDGAD